MNKFARKLADSFVGRSHRLRIDQHMMARMPTSTIMFCFLGCSSPERRSALEQCTEERIAAGKSVGNLSKHMQAVPAAVAVADNCRPIVGLGLRKTARKPVDKIVCIADLTGRSSDSLAGRRQRRFVAVECTAVSRSVGMMVRKRRT